jgi:YD repeat-containing protein
LTNNGAKWKLVDVNSDIYYFTGGLLTRKQFINGDVLNYQYFGSILSSVSDQLGRSLHYDIDGRLKSVVTPDNHSITYRYVSDVKAARDFRLLKSVSWDNGESVNYLYNESDKLLNSTLTNALTGKIDSYNNRVGIYKYNNDRAVYTEGALGSFKRVFDFGYKSTRVTTGLNSFRLYNFDSNLDGTLLLKSTSQPAGSGCAASTQNATYYDDGLKKTETDFNGNKTQYEYLHGRALETVRVEGIAANNSADYTVTGVTLQTGVRKTSTQWHSNWRKPVKKPEPHLITTYIYNGDADPFNGGQIAQCSSSPLPLLCHQVQQATTDVNGSLGLSATLDTNTSKRELSYTYNDRGQLSKRTRELNSAALETREYCEMTTSDYRTGDLKSVTNALGHKTQFTRYDANGRVLTMLDSNNVSNQFLMMFVVV